MSMRKRFLFAMLFTIVALAAAGRVSVYKANLMSKARSSSRTPVPAAAALPWYTANSQTCQVDGSRHSPRKANCCRRYFFRFNSRTPRIWVLESCWWRAAASATRISQEQWSCWSATMKKAHSD